MESLTPKLQVIFETLSRVIARYPTFNGDLSLSILFRAVSSPCDGTQMPKLAARADTPGPCWFGFWSCRRDFAHSGRCESGLCRKEWVVDGRRPKSSSPDPMVSQDLSQPHTAPGVAFALPYAFTRCLDRDAAFFGSLHQRGSS